MELAPITVIAQVHIIVVHAEMDIQDKIANNVRKVFLVLRYLLS